MKFRGNIIVNCLISDFLPHSFNSSGDVGKGVVPKKGLQPGNLNENPPRGGILDIIYFHRIS